MQVYCGARLTAAAHACTWQVDCCSANRAMVVLLRALRIRRINVLCCGMVDGLDGHVDEALASMLMAWYQSGFQTGYYVALNQRPR